VVKALAVSAFQVMIQEMGGDLLMVSGGGGNTYGG
jgi:hypothetical protein